MKLGWVALHTWGVGTAALSGAQAAPVVTRPCDPTVRSVSAGGAVRESCAGLLYTSENVNQPYWLNRFTQKQTFSFRTLGAKEQAVEEGCPGEAWPPARPNPLPGQDPHGAVSHAQRLNGLSWEEAVELQAGLELSVSLRRQWQSGDSPRAGPQDLLPAVGSRVGRAEALQAFQQLTLKRDAVTGMGLP
ncbi:hypothetical protein J1605_020092 [Eschrichtius robustus]|uniref:Uncharacterized protein n=1 Tax=Eschrichtius robustus TaxID=9764 RepID=A0AB34HKM4_ESCRO|nr:hypothetical protein J1605_020092 [Eschrichtius robustus]